MASNVKIVYGFFCEFLRVEASGQINAIGLWGSEFFVKQAFPSVLPSLSFHAFVSNPDHIPLAGKAIFKIPGLPKEPELPIELKADPKLNGYNINLSILMVPLSQEGTISVRLQLIPDSPVNQEFHLKVLAAPAEAQLKAAPIAKGASSTSLGSGTG